MKISCEHNAAHTAHTTIKSRNPTLLSSVITTLPKSHYDYEDHMNTTDSG